MKAINLTLIFLLTFLYSSSFRTEPKQEFEWKLMFEDQFDSFDKSKSLTYHDNGGKTIWSNKELQWYVEDNVYPEGGVLKLIGKKESIYGKDPFGEKQFEYTSGMITNAMSYVQAYGKWEMKVRFPFKKGFWPAFFLVPKQRPSLPEIDVFEYFGIKKDIIWMNHHWGLDYPNYSGGTYEGKTEPFYYQGGKWLEGKFDNEWMVWAIEVLPNKLVWKLNGNVVFEATDGIPTAPMYMIANVAIKDFPENNGVVDDSGLPYVMEIDYVKIYQMTPAK